MDTNQRFTPQLNLDSPYENLSASACAEVVETAEKISIKDAFKKWWYQGNKIMDKWQTSAEYRDRRVWTRVLFENHESEST